MLNARGSLAAPFPYFGGKVGAVETVWQAFGDVANYVEPFAGSAAMLLGAPDAKRIETINDFDGFVANFWRAIAADAEAVAHHADWPCNEVDLFARHGWLVRQAAELKTKLETDPDFYDAKIAGWWCWGACNWIGSGWCSGDGPWVLHDGQMVKGDAGRGINRKLPHLGDAGRGINRQLPHLGNAGQGINRQTEQPRRAYIMDWFGKLHDRLRDVRVACGDWQRVCKDSVTTRHGLTAVFLDPPYAKGAMDYGAGGMRLGIAEAVQAWCKANGQNKALRIVLCGHEFEHAELEKLGWVSRKWECRKGYASTEAALNNSKSETLWMSPNCLEAVKMQEVLF